MTPREALIAARALIADEKHWTRNAYARDPYGNTIHPLEPEAVCYCTTGALKKVTVYEEPEVYFHANKILSGTVNGSPITFNDAHSHAEVLAMFDVAIQRSPK